MTTTPFELLDALTLEDKIKTFEKMCKDHDWYYQYSDDQVSFYRGDFTLRRLWETFKWLHKNHPETKPFKIYRKYSPAHKNNPVGCPICGGTDV